MTNNEYMTEVNKNHDILRSLVEAWHPASKGTCKPLIETVWVAGEPIEIGAPITAPAAERACQVVRKQILAESSTDPVARFDQAVRQQNAFVINDLLNDAWFGVPESTACWKIPGFTEAVDLMEDPPQPEEPQTTASLPLLKEDL